MIARFSLMWLILFCALPVAFASDGKARTTVLDSCDNTLCWDLGRSTDRIAREFTEDKIETVNDARRGKVLRWTFEPRAVQFNDLFLRRRIGEPFESIGLWVRNRGEKLSFTMKLGDANGAEYSPKPLPLAGDGKWRRVVFSLRDFHVGSWSKDPDGRLDFPIRYLALIAFDVTPARLVTGLITERGVANASAEGLGVLYPEHTG